MRNREQSGDTVNYERTLNQTLLERCQCCEWWLDVDDSEFPGKFAFQLRYQVDAGEVVVRAIAPQVVVISDIQGKPLFTHEFSEREQTRIWQWFHARLSAQPERLLASMAGEIERDRQARSEAAAATFQSLKAELASAR